ncbi:hypothetical protein C8J56DRAFT_1029265 [Mycena floridula]|nr:hypothetical protein C8J56DRAFT_1029265 [Mycena floridula]
MTGDDFALESHNDEIGGPFLDREEAHQEKRILGTRDIPPRIWPENVTDRHRHTEKSPQNGSDPQISAGKFSLELSDPQLTAGKIVNFGLSNPQNWPYPKGSVPGPIYSCGCSKVVAIVRASHTASDRGVGSNVMVDDANYACGKLDEKSCGFCDSPPLPGSGSTHSLPLPAIWRYRFPNHCHARKRRYYSSDGYEPRGIHEITAAVEFGSVVAA